MTTPAPAPTTSFQHAPVLLQEAVAALAPRPGGLYFDGTFGGGGYSRAILDAAPGCRVLAVDRDPRAVAAAAPLLAAYGERLILRIACFSALETLLESATTQPLDGVVLDLGVSSPQLDDPARGFSFRGDGPLDMRMGENGPTAADIVAHWTEAALADLLWKLGEERYARRIARALVVARRESQIRTTGRLAEIVRAAAPRSADGLNPATRTFQALRLQVNDELGELDRGLAAAAAALPAGGRLVVTAFHSLEDRRVKRFLRGAEAPSRHSPVGAPPPPLFRPLTQRAVRPSAAETAANRRARSARLRAGERTGAAP